MKLIEEIDGKVAKLPILPYLRDIMKSKTFQ